MKSTHPSPLLDRVTQYSAAVLVAVMLLTVPLQIFLAVSVRPPLIFILTAGLTLMLVPFVVLLTASTPSVQVAAQGLTIQPLIWKAQFVPWSSVTAVKNYPLLPHADAELSRKTAAGRKKYRPAEGIMLVIPALPPQYRIAGLLAGEGYTSVIAVTNRTHTDYDQLVQQIHKFTA